MTWRQRLAAALPALVGVAVAVGFNARFQGEMAADPANRLLTGSFHGGHLWCFDHIWRLVAGLDAWGLNTDRLGFPAEASVRCLLVAPAVATAPLRLFVGPLAAYNLAVLLTPAVAVLATMALVRTVTALDRWSAAAAGVAFAVSPFVLGSLYGGQLCKAQVWTVPLCLWTLSKATLGPRRPAWALASLGAGVLTAYSEPTYAAILPLIVPLWGLLLLRRPWTSHAFGALAAGVALGVGYWTGSLYYLRPDDPGAIALFEPAGPLTSAGIPIPTPMAQPGPTLLGPPDLQAQAGEPNHVTYLGLPLLAAMVLGTLLPWSGRRLAWTALVVGVVASLGERLVVDDQWFKLDGRTIALPMKWLARHHYPLAKSMMYYRAVTVASLGVALGAVGAASRLRWGPWIAWAVLALALADTRRALDPIWPAHSRALDRELYETLAADPDPGAVVEVPLESNTRSGGLTVLDAVFHGRPSSGLVRFTQPDMPHMKALSGWLAEAATMDEAAASALLHEHGVRYVVARLDAPRAGLEPLVATLGPPIRLRRWLVWRVGPPLVEEG